MALRLPDANAVFGAFSGTTADPRPAQAVLLVPVLVDLGFRLAGTWADAFSWTDVVGWALVLLATAAAAAGPRPSGGLLIWLPVLDIAGIGLLRLTDGSPIAIALVFPAVWLGLQFRARGVVVAAGATLLTMLVPGLAVAGASSGNLARAALMLLTILLCAGTVALASGSWRHQQQALRDATRRAEDSNTELRVQRRLQEAFVTSADVGLALIGPDGRLSSVNPRQGRFLELAYPYGDEGPAYFFGPDGTAALDPERTPFARAAAGEEFEESLVWVGAEEPERRALVVSARALTDDTGAVTGAVLACNDVTDLIRAMRLRDRFVETISHELRTPVTNIVGYLDMALSDVEDMPAEVRPYLETAARNAERLVRLISDLLQVGDHQATLGMDQERVDLGELVLAAAEAAVTPAARAGVRLSCRIDAPAQVEGDQRRLRQLVDNLLSNAVKYSRRDDRVLIRLGREGDQATVTVQDTGIGVAPDEVDQLFTRFFRSREAHRLAIQGVGLGLAICKDVTEAHGGTISVRSEQGVGSQFVVRLPAVETAPAGRHLRELPDRDVEDGDGSDHPDVAQRQAG